MKKHLPITTLLILILCAIGMATAPTVIQPTDLLTTSRTTINNNFLQLYNAIEVLPTPAGANAIGFQPTGGTVPITVGSTVSGRTR